MERTGAKREPRAAKREPRGAKKGTKERATKMHQKINLRKRSRKSEALGGYQHQILEPFGSHFPLKFDEQIDAKIDAEKVTKIDDKTMRK